MELFFQEIGTNNIIKVRENETHFLVETGKIENGRFHTLSEPRKMSAIDLYHEFIGRYKYVSCETIL